MAMGKDALWLTVSRIASTGITMVITMLLSRFRTLEEYGTYSQINLVATVVVSIFSMGLPSCINYFLNRTDKQEDRQKFIFTYFFGGTIIGILIAVALLIIFPLIVNYFNNAILYDYKFAFLILPWVLLFNNSVENIYISYNKIRWIIAYRMAYCIILLGIVVLFVLLKGNFYAYMIVFCALQVVFVFILYFSAYILSEKSKRFFFDIGLIKEIITYSVPLGLSLIVSTLNIEIDKLMVARVYSTEDMAIYTNMSRELPLNILSISIATILLPKMVRLINNGEEKTAINLWGVSIKLSSIMIMFACMLLVVFAEPIIGILYSKKYLPGIDVFRIYSIASLVKITTWGIILNSTKKTKTILGISIIALFTNVVLNLALMPIFGMKGAALATLVSEFVTIIIKLFFSSKVMLMKFKKIVPWFDLFKILFLNFALGMVAFLLLVVFKNFFGLYISTIVSGVIILALYLCIIFKPFKNLWKEFNCF